MLTKHQLLAAPIHPFFFGLLQPGIAREGVCALGAGIEDINLGRERDQDSRSQTVHVGDCALHGNVPGV
eukprot:1160808-Pelagomonas_calceolata.AAC.37